jgi:EmrB/QacA subfamily drug resistance transporter
MTNIFRQPCDEGVICARPTAVSSTAGSEPWVMAATILGSSMVFIDGTVVNVALPALQKSLDASVLDVQWVVESYALFLAALLLVGGSMGDRYGRRRMFCAGVGLFGLASVGCGLSQNIGQLIAARAVQGVAGALLVPGSLAILSASFDESRRGQAIGTWSAFTAITAGIGPILGGWLIEHVSWRAAFFINVPVALLVLLIAYWRVPESRDDAANASLDWSGAIVASFGFGALVYALIESSHLGFAHPLALVTLLGAVILLAAFFLVEARSANPMLPLGLFRSRNFAGANLLTIFLYTALAGGMFFFPLRLIQIEGYSATAAGAAWVPFILIIFILSPRSGSLVKRYGPRPLLVLGPSITALAYMLFMVPGAGGSYWNTFFPAIVVLGIGMGLSVAPLTTTVMNSVPGQRAGIASGINNAVSRTGGLLGVAIFGIIMVHSFNGQLDRRLARIELPPSAQSAMDQQRARLAGAEIPSSIDREMRAALTQAIKESFIFGFRMLMLAAAGLALVSALVAFKLIDNN